MNHDHHTMAARAAGALANSCPRGRRGVTGTGEPESAAPPGPRRASPGSSRMVAAASELVTVTVAAEIGAAPFGTAY